MSSHEADQQAATEIDRAKQARSKAEEQVTPGSPTEVRPGGTNNPQGLGGKSGKTGEEIVNDRNASIDNKPKASHTDTTEGILRRLTRAAKGIKSHGVEPSPELQVLCADLLDRFERGEISANQAAIEAGLRKLPSVRKRQKHFASQARPSGRLRGSWELVVQPLRLI